MTHPQSTSTRKVKSSKAKSSKKAAPTKRLDLLFDIRNRLVKPKNNRLSSSLEPRKGLSRLFNNGVGGASTCKRRVLLRTKRPSWERPSWAQPFWAQPSWGQPSLKTSPWKI